MAVPDPKWLDFEDEVFEALKMALAAGRFPFDGDVRVLRDGQYNGLTPGNIIKIEIALEAYRNSASEPFLIWLWECKGKNQRKVDVGEVRELYSKLQEIGVSRAVGSLVTTIGFQKGAIDLAKKIGISLYLLQEKLVPISKHERGAEESVRRIIVAEQWLDLSGAEGKDTFFDTAAKADFGQVLSRMMREPDAADPWESIKKRLNERPIHAGGLHFTRDELHERR